MRPLLGRAFGPAEDRPGVGGTLLLSYSLWQVELGGDRGALGRRVTLDGEPFVILGVMPRGFQYPDATARFWIPARFAAGDFAERNDYSLQVVARLSPGVSVARAQAQMSVVAAQLERQYPRENRDAGIAVLRWRDELPGQARLLLLALCGAALCVLLIACANLANLLLTRALARRQEMDVRAALGAGRERLLRQLATESVALAVAGGLLGMAVARTALPLLSRLVPTTLPLGQEPALDPGVMGFGFVLAVLTGLAFGLLPALRGGREGALANLRQGARAGGGQRGRLRAALVVAEVTASVVLLVGAGLLLRAMLRLQDIDPGFRSAGVTTLRTELPMPRYAATTARATFYDRVVTAVRALPGVAGAAYVTALPMTWKGGIWPVTVDGRPADTSGADVASLRFMTPGYLAALGIPLELGRDVAAADTAGRPWVAVVSHSFAARYWPGQNPLGRHFQFGLHDRAVAGVAGDVRVRGPEKASEPQVYLSYRQVADGFLTFYAPRDLVVRTAAGAPAPLPAIRRIVRQADPEQPISEVRPLAAVIAAETAPRAVQLRVLAAFAAIAFLLAGVGIHGLLSYAVSQRSGEIGVRMALGASEGDILAMVLRQGALLGVAGIVLGALGAYAGGRAMAALLAGVQPGDAGTFAAAAGLCLLMTLTGSLLPARRAARIDPASIIRKE